jgi:outer membrane protein TolC
LAETAATEGPTQAELAQVHIDQNDQATGKSTCDAGVIQASSLENLKPNTSLLASSGEATPSPIVAPAEQVEFATSSLVTPVIKPTDSPQSPPTTNEMQPTIWPIDLATALEYTTGQNPQVNYAREKIRESLAKWDGAKALWLPSLRAGANYHKHDGRIQDVAGTIIETSRNSVYNGFGSQAVGAGSPAVPGVLMNFHLRDGIFQPRIAGQVVGASRQAGQAAINDMLLETALAYCNLLEAAQLRVIAIETESNAGQLQKLTADYAAAGAGLPSDADRSTAEAAFRKMEVQRLSEQLRIRSSRLSQLMSHDPQVVLEPLEEALAPIDLINLNTDLSSMVAHGLSSRPELSEQRYLVGEAIERLRRERYAPLVPSVLLGLSYGGNGGGLGSSFSNYGDRMDFDAAAFWEIRNLGVGERAARCEAQSRLRQARFKHVAALDKVAAEIVEANAQVQAKRDQIPLAELAVSAAQESYRRNQERILNAKGLPIENLQAIIALDQARRLYATTIADYNRAQFCLHHAIGYAVMDAK